jgi:hypothetical protein
MRRRSVTDLFGDAIVLRDMRLRRDALATPEDRPGGISRETEWAPRKRDAGYARELLRLIESLGDPEKIVYVGDSLLQDGVAIRELRQVVSEDRVWGFLCHPNGVQPGREGVVDGVFLGARWISLSAFIERAQEEGLRFGPGTWVLFDLDQTVYAAKGRDEEPLSRARSSAVGAYLESRLSAESFDSARAECLYREFGRDRYHRLTQDNLDYVVGLALAVLCGLTNVDALREEARRADSGIIPVIEQMLHRASMRVDSEVSSEAREALEEMRLGALAGDPTPCKNVRRRECLATAAQMLSGDENGGGICLNREVVELLEWVVSAGAQVLAVSDRPVEAASVTHCGEVIDVMTIPMPIRGESLPPLSLEKRV